MAMPIGSEGGEWQTESEKTDNSKWFLSSAKDIEQDKTRMRRRRRTIPKEESEHG